MGAPMKTKTKIAPKKFVPPSRMKKAKETYPWESLTGEDLYRHAAKAAAEGYEIQQRAAKGRVFVPVTEEDRKMRPFYRDRQQTLADRQADARSLRMPVPVGITEWGESVFAPRGDEPVSVKEEGTTVAVPKAPPPKPAVRGPGVIDTIIKVLTEEASKTKPMSKAKLLKRLTALIPGREPDKMASTIRAQLADSGLKAKGVRVRTDGNGGYWIRKNP